MQEVLDAPDAVGGVGRPRRELLGNCTEVRPFSRAGEGGEGAAGRAEGGEFFWGEEGGDQNEAIAIEGRSERGEVWSGGGELGWMGGFCQS